MNKEHQEILELVIQQWCGAEPETYGPSTRLEELWRRNHQAQYVPYHPNGVDLLLAYLRRHFSISPLTFILLKDENIQTVGDLYEALSTNEVSGDRNVVYNNWYSVQTDGRGSGTGGGYSIGSTKRKGGAAKGGGKGAAGKGGAKRGSKAGIKGRAKKGGVTKGGATGTGRILPRKRKAPSAPVRFTAYYYTEIKPEVWYTLLAYAHVPKAERAVESDSRRRMDQDAGSLKKSGSATTANIKRGAEIVVVPEMPGCVFNPPRASFLWLEDWHRAEFRMKAGAGRGSFKAGEAVNGSVSFYVGPVLVGEVKIWAHFSDEAGPDEADRPDASATADPYQAVFVSYSHEDALIVEELERAYSALGIKYLRDVRVLRSGEEWNPALLKKIDEADIFQLCWSSAARRSRYVKQEWRHALGLERSNFIRPTYWQQPIPKPPKELAHVHFAFLNLKG